MTPWGPAIRRNSAVKCIVNVTFSGTLPPLWRPFPHQEARRSRVKETGGIECQL
jgi:hypothetical protein